MVKIWKIVTLFTGYEGTKMGTSLRNDSMFSFFALICRRRTNWHALCKCLVCIKSSDSQTVLHIKRKNYRPIQCWSFTVKRKESWAWSGSGLNWKKPGLNLVWSRSKLKLELGAFLSLVEAWIELGLVFFLTICKAWLNQVKNSLKTRPEEVTELYIVEMSTITLEILMIALIFAMSCVWKPWSFIDKALYV